MGQELTKVGEAVVILQNPESWISRREGQDVELPSTVANLKVMMKEGVALNLVQNFSLAFRELPDFKKQLVKYSGSALIHGRPLSSVMIVTAGETGRGKSTLIHKFFDEKIYVCETDRTTRIHEYLKRVRATVEDPPIVGQVKFVDFPGALDEDPDKNVENFARLKLFRDNHPELQDRHSDSEIEVRDVSIRKQVFPNLVLLVASTADKVIRSESSFRQSAIYLKGSGMIDAEYSNLIVVVTRAMEFQDNFSMRTYAMRMDIEAVIEEEFGISNVPVVFVENKCEQYRNIQKEGDFYILPNGDKNYGNLKETMEKVLEKNEDNLARQFISHYFHPKCPEKHVSAFENDSKTFDSKLSETDHQHARNLLKSLGIYKGKQATQTNTELRFLGKGYCPKTEKPKFSSVPFQSNYRVIKLMNQTLQLPAIVKVIPVSELTSDRLNFKSKEEYENHQSHKYGFQAGQSLIISGKIDGHWSNNSKHSTLTEFMKFVYSFHFAKLEIVNIEDHIDQKLKDGFQSLPASYDKNTQSMFELFFEKHGTHLIRAINLGASLVIECEINKSAFEGGSQFGIETKLEGTFKKIITCGADGKSCVESKSDLMSKLSCSTVKFFGGDPPHDVTSVDDMSPDKIKAWINSAKVLDPPTELTDGIELHAYYHLIPGTEKQLALRSATNDYLKRNMDEPKTQMNITRERMAESHAQAGRTHAQAQAESGGCCFSASTMIQTSNRGIIPITELIPGDSVFSKNGSSSKFLTYLHFDSEIIAQFLGLEMEDGTQLLVTPDHLIFRVWPANGDISAVPAATVKSGDYLLSLQSDRTHLPIRVIGVFLTELKGIYCPLVNGGSFSANGLLVSCYANIKSHELAHISMAPLRLYCRIRRKLPGFRKQLNKSGASYFGIHNYAKLLMGFRKAILSLLDQQ